MFFVLFELPPVLHNGYCIWVLTKGFEQVGPQTESHFIQILFLYFLSYQETAVPKEWPEILVKDWESNFPSFQTSNIFYFNGEHGILVVELPNFMLLIHNTTRSPFNFFY